MAAGLDIGFTHSVEATIRGIKAESLLDNLFSNNKPRETRCVERHYSYDTFLDGYVLSYLSYKPSCSVSTERLGSCQRRKRQHNKSDSVVVVVVVVDV